MERIRAVHEDGCYNVSGEHVVPEVLAVLRRDVDRVQEAREDHGRRLGDLDKIGSSLEERTRRHEVDIRDLMESRHRAGGVMQLAISNSERALEEIEELKSREAAHDEKLWEEIGALRNSIVAMKDEVHGVAIKVAIIVGAIAAAGGVGGSFLASALKAAG